MRRQTFVSTICVFGAGFILGALLVYAIPAFLAAQRPVQHHPDYMPAAYTQTDDPFDVAIFGRGYFRLDAPDGSEMYTRRSSFELDSMGVLTIDGYTLSDYITIPHDAMKFSVNPDGAVVVVQPGGVLTWVGQIQLAGFHAPNRLKFNADGYLIETPESGVPVLTNPCQDGLGLLAQGWVLEHEIKPDTPEENILTNEFYQGVNDDIQETLIETENPLDYAIEGRGFIGVHGPDGTMKYTRYLRLHREETGKMNREYGIIQGSFGGLSLEYQIEFIVGDVSEVPLYRFHAPEKLDYYFWGMYSETELSGAPQKMAQGEGGTGILKQGFINDVPRLRP